MRAASLAYILSHVMKEGASKKGSSRFDENLNFIGHDGISSVLFSAEKGQVQKENNDSTLGLCIVPKKSWLQRFT